MNLKIHHQTKYRYETPSLQGLQQIRLAAQSTADQRVVDWHLSFENALSQASYFDHFENKVELISFMPDAHEITVNITGTVEVSNTAGILRDAREQAPKWLYLRPGPLTNIGQRIKKLVGGVNQSDPLAMLHHLMRLIHKKINYQIGASNVRWTAEDALKGKVGVCQDQAHVFIASARTLEFPARYVSGYLFRPDTDEQSAMHAWAEVHVLGLGWVGFDVANCISPDDRYVKVAVGLDYDDAAPIKGVQRGGKSESQKVVIKVSQQ